MDAAASPTPSPEPAKAARLGRRIRRAVAILALLVVALNFLGDATEANARRLGGVPRSIGSFTGTRETDLRFERDADEGTIESIVRTSR